MGQGLTQLVVHKMSIGDGALHLWQVSRAVNDVRNNGAELLDHVDDPQAPPPSGAPAGPNPA